MTKPEQDRPSAERQAQRLVEWFRVHARDLPWRRGYDPYAILVSEFMLQQTQVATVIPYFERWMARWPDLGSLAQAEEAEALKMWEGLGYYSRCRNLLKAARALMEAGHAEPPASLEALRACPGIGEYTAGAVVSVGHDLPVPAVDGNAERVLSRLLGLEGTSGNAALRREVAIAVVAMLSGVSPRELNQALMDLGAMVCVPRKPKCGDCPWGEDCRAHALGTEEAYPQPKPRPAVSRDEAWGLLALHSLGILLRRRPQSGLWAGMWELPWFPRTSEDLWQDVETWTEAPELVTRLRRDTLAEIGAVSFSFTTHRVRARVVSCELEEGPIAEGWRLVPPSELKGLTLPAPSRKFLEAFEKASRAVCRTPLP